MAEFLLLRNAPASPPPGGDGSGSAALAPSWFSLSTFTRLHGTYVDLDRDRDGLLTVEELGGWNRGSLSRAFVEAVFDTYHTYRRRVTEGAARAGRQEMDWKGFLDFALALEYRSTLPSMRYVFHALDAGRKGYLSPFDLRVHLRGLADALARLGAPPLPVSLDALALELLDMVRPADPERVTLDDLRRSRSGHSFLYVLTDVQGFWAHEEREAQMQASAPQPHASHGLHAPLQMAGAGGAGSAGALHDEGAFVSPRG
jgi:serine/threonine-protein phosphatase 2A regulatory subunit B''